MNLIYSIVFFLLITPFFWVITDYKIGKIKNYYIFPFFFISFILTFFISWFYNNFENILWLIIIFLLWYLFYINNKWWAWDWKYIILIWLNSLIIAFLLWISINILNVLFLYVFLFLFVYILFYIIINIRKIKKISLKNEWKINLLNDFFIISTLFIISYSVSIYFSSKYDFLIIFLWFIILVKYLLYIKNNIVKYLIILFWLIFAIYTKSYFSIVIFPFFYYTFYYLQIIIENIFDIIDIKMLKILEITQWMILTKKSIDIVKTDIQLEYSESPLQWNEVFDIISKYKEIWKNPNIFIYKDLKIGYIIYIWYLFAILTNI